MVKIGIVGCGGIAGLHMDMLAKLKDKAEVIAVADVDEKKAADAKARMGAKYSFKDHRELLKSGVDAILCCTPTFFHTDIVVDAARAGKHVFCEKPICMSIENADKMIAESKKAKVILQVGFVRRFDDERLKYRELIQSGAIGRPVYWRHVAGGSTPPAPWFMDEKIGGGPFVDGAVHSYDFARFTFGEAKEVCANITKFRKDRTALDSGVAVITFRSGDVQMLSWSWGLPDGCGTSGLHDTMGPGGALIFGAPEGDHTEFIISSEKEKGKTGRVKSSSLMDGFLKQTDHFIDCCAAGGKTPAVTGEDGREALRIALAILQSAKTGKPVSLK